MPGNPVEPLVGPRGGSRPVLKEKPTKPIQTKQNPQNPCMDSGDW